MSFFKKLAPVIGYLALIFGPLGFAFMVILEIADKSEWRNGALALFIVELCVGFSLWLGINLLTKKEDK